MGSTEKFCLRWNDFESNISVSFRELREDNELFDITLACEEEQVQAHKVILSACSPFFRSVLKRNKHEHPLLYLKGVKFTELQAVLNFMYQGEVNVAQEDLNSFLAVAEELKVKGLTQSNSKPSSPPPPQPKMGRPPREQRSSGDRDLSSGPPSSKRTRMSAAASTTSNNLNCAVNSKKSYASDANSDTHEIVVAQNAANVKMEPVGVPMMEDHSAPAVQQYVEPSGVGGVVMADDSGGALAPAEFSDDYEYEGGGGGYEHGYDDTMLDTTGAPSADGNKDLIERNDDLDKQIEERMSRLMGSQGEGMMWVCDVCKRKYKDKTKMRHHIETHLDSFVSCPICNQLCKTRRTLKTHIGRSHGKDGKASNTDTFQVVNLDTCMEPKIELS